MATKVNFITESTKQKKTATRSVRRSNKKQDINRTPRLNFEP